MGINCCSSYTPEKNQEIDILPLLIKTNGDINKIDAATKEAGMIIVENQGEIQKQFKIASKTILLIQSWYRGYKSRKNNKVYPGLRPITIIRYVGEKLKACQEAVKKVEDKLGPFEANWDVKPAVKERELRKLQTEENGCSYYGYWRLNSNKKDGYGQQIYPSGAKYEGFWEEGEINGKGRLIYENGDYYIGDFINGKAHGEGTFIDILGNKYAGQWKNNIHHGQGKESMSDGSVYEGNFVEGIREGHGKISWKNGCVYEGNYSNGKISGQGTCTWKDGMKYTGNWKNNLMEGEGCINYPDGRIYKGSMVNDLRHGYGEMAW